MEEGWVEYKDAASGRSYYYNAEKNVTTWDKNKLAVNQSRKRSNNSKAVAEEDGWVQHFDKASGKPYYYNAEKNATVWKIPKSSYSTNNVNTQSTLAPGWKEYFHHSSGKHYYYNKAKNITVWEKPLAQGTSKRIQSLSRDIVHQLSWKVKKNSREAPGGSKNGPLAVGWVEYFDEASGKHYYYNKEKNITVWEKPLAERPPAEPSKKIKSLTRDLVQPTGGELAPGWVEYFNAPSGKYYYFNAEQNLTVWEKPLAKSDVPVETSEKIQSLTRELVHQSSWKPTSNAPVIPEDPNVEKISFDELKKIQLVANPLFGGGGAAAAEATAEENTMNPMKAGKNFKKTFYSDDPLEFTREFLLAAPPGQFNMLLGYLHKLTAVPYKKKFIETVQRDYHRQLCYSTNEETVRHPLARPLWNEVEAYQTEKYASMGVTARKIIFRKCKDDTDVVDNANDDDDDEEEEDNNDSVDDENTIMLRTYAEINQPPKCKTGSWLAEWTIRIQPSEEKEAEVFGIARIASFSYEEGNIQMRTYCKFPHVNVTLPQDGKQESSSYEALAKAIVNRIAANEHQLYRYIKGQYAEEPLDLSLKVVRRILPITRDRLPWDLLSHRAAQNNPFR